MSLQTSLQQAWTHRGLLAWLLWPVSLLFAALVALRRGLYRADIFTSHALPVPVIVVGNVAVGGVGKTPIVIALVAHLQAQGYAVGVVSRGYGRVRPPGSPDCCEVTPDAQAHAVGDEPLLIRQRTNAPVFAASNRVDAAQSLLKAYPSTHIIVCDDGLQHLALRRDVEICVFDDRGVGNGFLLPAGLLREPWPRPESNSKTTVLILHTGHHPAFAGHRASRRLADVAVRADGTQVSLAALAQTDAPPLLAVAGIAQPEVFFAELRRRGLNLQSAQATQALPDHFDFDSWKSPSDKRIQLICTEKDAVKLWQLDPLALAVPLEVTLAPELLASVDAAILAIAAKLSSTPMRPPLSQ